MARRIQLCFLGFTAIVSLLLVAWIILPISAAQLNESRRTTDLSPVSLPNGGRIEFKAFDSQKLGMAARYSIFLPSSYSKDLARTYPVIYFLHGLNNDETSWTTERYGQIQNTLDQMMSSGKLPEFIMIHPRGDSSFYCNYIDGSRKYEDFIAEELISYMEKNYRAAKGRENRAIAGTSMGGYGALKIAMKFPDRYSAVVAQSPILFPGTNPLELSEDAKASRFYSFFVNMLKPVFGEPVQQELWDANNPLILAKKQKLTNLSIYFDYGTDDRYIPLTRLDEGNQALDRILTQAGVPHVFKMHAGEPHGWALVSAHLSETLPLLCRTFKK